MSKIPNKYISLLKVNIANDDYNSLALIYNAQANGDIDFFIHSYEELIKCIENKVVELKRLKVNNN